MRWAADQDRPATAFAQKAAYGIHPTGDRAEPVWLRQAGDPATSSEKIGIRTMQKGMDQPMGPRTSTRTNSGASSSTAPQPIPMPSQRGKNTRGVRPNR
jgi:hypothetical protein